jgi:hypothetical protein
MIQIIQTTINQQDKKVLATVSLSLIHPLTIDIHSYVIIVRMHVLIGGISSSWSCVPWCGKWLVLVDMAFE